VRITVPHRKTKAEAVATVDRAMLHIFDGLAAGPLTVSEAQKTWSGSTMTFSLVAKMGFLSNPIRGSVEVTDENITIDADLGLLARLMPQEKVRTVVETRVRGLLT
jgi:Putative polyhydroxyalkanoic acid system protein (PHA_gran_rgn)